MLKVRRGWYLVDEKLDEDVRRTQNKKKDQLQMRQIALINRCDDKIARRRSWAEQQKFLEKEELSRAQEAADLKQRKLETTYRLAIELSRLKNEETKHALKHREKISMKLPLNCTSEKARTYLIEKKVHLEADQAELLRLWYQDETFQEMQKIEEEKRKQKLRIDLQNQLTDNRQRAQKERNEEKEQDREMTEEIIRETQEEDTRMRRQKNDDAILLKSEIARTLAAKEAWEKKFRETLKAEDERITRIIAKKTTQEKKMVHKESEYRIMKEVTIDKAARKLLENVHKKREREQISNELYQEEQKSKWAKEPARLALKKQCVVADASREMERQQRVLIERKAKDDAIEAAFAKYLLKEWKKNLEKQKEYDNTRRERNIQYGKELKEAIMNKRASYAMNILERQSETCVQDKNQPTTSGTGGSNDKNDKIEEIDTNTKEDKYK